MEFQDIVSRKPTAFIGVNAAERVYNLLRQAEGPMSLRDLQAAGVSKTAGQAALDALAQAKALTGVGMGDTATIVWTGYQLREEIR